MQFHHSLQDIRTGVLLLVVEELLNLLANLVVGDLDVVLHVAVLSHEGEETVVGDVELSSLVSETRPSTFLQQAILTSWNSRRETFGTSMLWVDGDSSSSFLPVKMSMATMWTLA